jgi:endonuclease/exonuclease/phosphatase family metal-dependent hydrolase
MLATLPVMLVVAAAASAPELTVMSYNIRYGTADDGDNAWPNRRDRLAEVIRDFAPDLLGVQECLDFQAAWLAGELRGYHWFGMGREEGGSGEMAPVFYRTEVLAPVSAGHFWLSETPDTPASKGWDASNVRIATWVRFLHRPSGAQFLLLNTHFDHRGERAREASAGLIIQRVRELSDGLPVIITGDFNTLAEKSMPWQALQREGFEDAWVVAEEREGATQTFTGFNMPMEGVDMRIDWILFRGPWHAARCEAFVDRTRGGAQPSDHLPIIARLVPAPAAP